MATAPASGAPPRRLNQMARVGLLTDLARSGRQPRAREWRAIKVNAGKFNIVVQNALPVLFFCLRGFPSAIVFAAASRPFS
jgi:hypothetical protein